MKKKFTIILFITLLFGFMQFLQWSLSQFLMPIKPDFLSINITFAILLVSFQIIMAMAILISIKFLNIKLFPIKIKWPNYNELLFVFFIVICTTLISTSFHFMYTFSKEHLVFITPTLPSFKSLYHYCFFIVTLFFSPIIEELLYRKIIFTKLKEHFPLYFSFLLSSILFSLMHLDYNNFILFILIGLIYAYIYHVSKSIILTIICHSFHNTITHFTKYKEVDYSSNTLFLYIAIFLSAYFGVYFGLKRLKTLNLQIKKGKNNFDDKTKI